MVIIFIHAIPDRVDALSPTATSSATSSGSSSASATASSIPAPLFLENNIIVSGALGYTGTSGNDGTVEQHLYEINYEPSTKIFTLIRQFPMPNSTLNGKYNYTNSILGDNCDDYNGQLNLNGDAQYLITSGLNVAPLAPISSVTVTTERFYSFIDYTGTIKQYGFSTSSAKLTTSGANCGGTSNMLSVVPLTTNTAGVYYAGGVSLVSSASTTDGIFYLNTTASKTIFPISNSLTNQRYRYMYVYNNQLYATRSDGIYAIGIGLPTTTQSGSSVSQYVVYTSAAGVATPGVTVTPDARGFIVYNDTLSFVADGANGLIRAVLNPTLTAQYGNPTFDSYATAPLIAGTNTYDKVGRAVTVVTLSDNKPYLFFTTKTGIYVYDINKIAWVTVNATSKLAVSFPVSNIKTSSSRTFTFRGVSKAPRSIRYGQLFPTPSPSPSSSQSATSTISTTPSNSPSASPSKNNATVSSPVPSTASNTTTNTTTEASASPSSISKIDNNSTNTNTTVDENSPTPSPSGSISASSSVTPSTTASETPAVPSLVIVPVRILQVSIVITLPNIDVNSANMTIFNTIASAGAVSMATYLKVNVSSIIILGIEPVYKLRNSRRLQASASSSPSASGTPSNTPSSTPSGTPTPSTTPTVHWNTTYSFEGYSIKFGIDLTTAANSSTIVQWVNSTNGNTNAIDETVLLSAVTSLFNSNSSNSNTNNGPSSFFSFLLGDDSFAQSLGFANATAAASTLSNLVSSVPSTKIESYDKPTIQYVKNIPGPTTTTPTEDNSSLGVIIGAAAGGGGGALIIIAIAIWYCKCRSPPENKLLSSKAPMYLDSRNTAIIMNPLAMPTSPQNRRVRHATMADTYAAAGLTVRSFGTTNNAMNTTIPVPSDVDLGIKFTSLSHLGRSNHSRMKSVLDPQHPSSTVRPLDSDGMSMSMNMNPSSMIQNVSLSINPLPVDDRFSSEPTGKGNSKTKKKVQDDSDDDDSD